VEKELCFMAICKKDLPWHKQGNHAPMLSTKHAALDVAPEEDIPNAAFSAPHF
jgi:hypothetical protein